MEIILIISVMAIYLFYRYRKNQSEITTGLVKSNLAVYKNSIFRGDSFEAALNWMIESRYLNNPVYSPQRSNEMIITLKHGFETNKTLLDERSWVLEIITTMYEMENADLPDIMKSKHLVRIVSDFHNYWGFY